MLELAILGLLKERPMHGYELRKELSAKLGSFWQVSFGSLYPTLKRLAKRGAVEVLFDDRSTARRRKIYRITQRGEQDFLDLIEDRAATTWEEEKFPLRLAFFRYLTPQVRIRLLERRKAYLHDKLADLKASLDEAPGHVDSYTMSLLQHGIDATAADIAWLDDLIAAERRQLTGAEDDAVSPETEQPDEDPAPAKSPSPRRVDGATARTRP
ncbi:MAG: PadR family transcriptional regulator [Actinobacteria bacterium]|nr:PadR family transcriptional regulator [Actinomycetota bacterium]